MTDGLRLEDVCVAQGDTLLLRINTTVVPGEILTIMGPSGSGKSSLLAYLTGTLSGGLNASGKVELNGRILTDLSAENRRIGILFQDDLLFPHLSVGANLAFGMQPGSDKHDRSDRIDAALAEVGLEGFATRDPATLSGGQRARVSLMRTLISEPEALLLDEPFSRLDSTLRDQIRQLVYGRIKARNIPAVLVTHDVSDANAAAGPVITLGES